jgi:predicted ATPase
LNLWILGRPDQAVRTSQEAIALAQTLNHRYSVVFALLFDAMLQHHCRNADGVRRQTETAIELAAKQNWWAAALRSWAGALRGWALVEQGQAEEGIVLLREALEGVQAARFESLRPYFLALLAESYMTKGDYEAGLKVLADALEIIERTGEGYIEPELHRLKGECLAESPEKEACFAKAIEIARRQRALSYELRAVMSLSRLYGDRGQHRLARQMVADLYGSFTEGFDTQDLRDALALVHSLSQGPSAADRG